MWTNFRKFSLIRHSDWFLAVFSLVISFSLSACGSTPNPPTDLPSTSSPSSTSRALRSPTSTTRSPYPVGTLTPTKTFPATIPFSTLTPTISPLQISNLNADRIELQTVINYLPRELVTAVSWAPNGEMLASAAGESVYVYESGSLQLIHTFYTGALTHGLAFSPDSNLLAAGSHDGMVRVWELSRMQAAIEPVLSLQAHKKGTNSIAFSPDGRWLASGGNDGVVRVWDVKSGERLQQIIGGSYSIPRIAFTLDGASLAIANGPLVRLREVESGRIAETYRLDPLVEKGVWIYPTLYSLTYSPDGRYLAAGDHLNQVNIWDLQSQEKPLVPLTLARQIDSSLASPMTLVWDLDYSPDGSLLLAASGTGIRIWDAASGKLLNSLPQNDDVVTSLAFNPSGTILTSGGLDASLKFWVVKP